MEDRYEMLTQQEVAQLVQIKQEWDTIDLEQLIGTDQAQHVEQEMSLFDLTPLLANDQGQEVMQELSVYQWNSSPIEQNLMQQFEQELSQEQPGNNQSDVEVMRQVEQESNNDKLERGSAQVGQEQHVDQEMSKDQLDLGQSEVEQKQQEEQESTKDFVEAIPSANGQEQQLEQEMNIEHVEQFKPRPLTFEDAASEPVLTVYSSKLTAEFHKIKFGSGSNGKCIKYGEDNRWMTPKEFALLSGRARSVSWKRAIRFGDHTLFKLIDKGFLSPHDVSCKCNICLNIVTTATVTPPAKHVANKRQKRTRGWENVGHAKKLTLEGLGKEDLDAEELSDPKIRLETINRGFQLISQAVTQIKAPQPPPTEDAWKTFQDAVEKIETAGSRLKTLIPEMMAKANFEIASLKSELQIAKHAISQDLVLQQSQMPGLGNVTPIPVSTLQVFHLETLQALHPATKCEVCDLPGSLKCAECRAVEYCSPFCASNNWPVHREICQRLQPPVGSTSEI